MSRSVLIDASNLKSGGGLQVGASFVDEIAKLSAADLARWPWLPRARIEISPHVAANLTADTSHLDVIVVVRSVLGGLLRARGRRYSVSFTVFGPVYAARRAERTIVGFADSTSLWPAMIPPYPDARRRLRWWFRRRISRVLFRRADNVVVEADHVRNDLVRLWGMSRDRIAVVPNTLNGVFAAPAKEQSRPDIPTFVYPTRLYAHKNVDLLGEAAQILEARTGQRVAFLLTLTGGEWSQLSRLTQDYAINYGPQKVEALPALYRAATGTVFPSLCECFSITPLEAMAMGSPLAAAQRPFVSDVVADAAWYFEPTDPESLAEALDGILRNRQLRDQRVEQGLIRARAWPTPRDRAASYLDLIAEAASCRRSPAKELDR